MDSATKGEKMPPWNSSTKLGQIAFDVIMNNFHRPLVDGKCDRQNIEDKILDGVYLGLLPAMNKADVDFVCDLVDDLISTYGGKKK